MDRQKDRFAPGLRVGRFSGRRQRWVTMRSRIDRAMIGWHRGAVGAGEARGRGLATISVCCSAIARRTLGQLGCEKICEVFGAIAGKARFRLSSMVKENIEPIEIETHYRLLERMPYRLRVEKRQHHLVNRARGHAKIE